MLKSLAAGSLKSSLSAWFASAVRLPETRLERLLGAATAALLLTGFWLRARGYLYQTIPLNLDEVVWGVKLFEQPLKDALIPGFMALAKTLTALVSHSEAGLRFLPWAAGIATLFLSSALSKPPFNSPAARLSCVGAVALQPAAISAMHRAIAEDTAPDAHGFIVMMSGNSSFRWALKAMPRDLHSVDTFSVRGRQFVIETERNRDAAR